MHRTPFSEIVTQPCRSGGENLATAALTLLVVWLGSAGLGFVVGRMFNNRRFGRLRGTRGYAAVLGGLWGAGLGFGAACLFRASHPLAWLAVGALFTALAGARTAWRRRAPPNPLEVKAPPQPARSRRWARRLALPLAFLLIATTVLGWGYRKEIADAWFVWQFRHAAAAGGPPLDTLFDRLGHREDGLEMAVRLAEDPDPRVRAVVLDTLRAQLARREDGPEWAARLSDSPDPQVRAALLDCLVGKATPAPRIGPESPQGAIVSYSTGIGGPSQSTLAKLLGDPDPDVRRKAIRAASGIKAANEFRAPLLAILRGGDPADRVIVAEYLAHWAPDAVRETFTDPSQPAEVRLAALHSADSYGWDGLVNLAPDDEGRFLSSMEKVLAEPDARVRHGAIEVLFHTQADLLWLKVTRTGPAEDRRFAFGVWVERLAGERLRGGDYLPTWEATENLLNFDVQERQDGRQQVVDGERVALLGSLLCQAAKVNTEQLDTTPPASETRALLERQQQGGGPATDAFSLQLGRLMHILRALAAVRWCCRNAAHWQPGGDVRFTDWLPFEPPSDRPPPVRKVKDFLLEQVRPVLAWARAHGDTYASRFLRVSSSRFGGEDPGPHEVRTLGRVLKDMHLDTDEGLDR